MKNIAIIGSTGAVGQQLIQLLEDKSLTLFDSKSSISFEGIDLAFFCVSSEIAKPLILEAQKQGVICIDASSAFRDDPSVPLVIPEINADALIGHQGIIASPNCTTTMMLLPLAPLHRKFQIKRIVASTYQAVSGAGARGIEELESQTRDYLEKRPIQPKVFPHPCAFNVFPHESSIDDSGYAEEERKMMSETQRILEDESIGVSATCIRVPVFRAHSMSVNVEFANPISKQEAIELLQKAPGVTFQEDWKRNYFPMPVDVSHQNHVFCGRVRRDLTQENTLELWISADQLLKGAALNMAQIAKCLD